MKKVESCKILRGEDLKTDYTILTVEVKLGSKRGKIRELRKNIHEVQKS